MPSPSGGSTTAAPEAADAFMRALKHPLRRDYEAVRAIVLGVSPKIADGVKWNSLSFRTTEWFATVNLRNKDAAQLVFHLGAKARALPKGLAIKDSRGLVKWLAKDRALVTLGRGEAIVENRKAFEAIVKAWIKYV